MEIKEIYLRKGFFNKNNNYLLFEKLFRKEIL